jgi:hypothetical protein
MNERIRHVSLIVPIIREIYRKMHSRTANSVELPVPSMRDRTSFVLLATSRAIPLTTTLFSLTLSNAPLNHDIGAVNSRTEKYSVLLYATRFRNVTTIYYLKSMTET